MQNSEMKIVFLLNAIKRKWCHAKFLKHVYIETLEMDYVHDQLQKLPKSPY